MENDYAQLKGNDRSNFFLDDVGNQLIGQYQKQNEPWRYESDKLAQKYLPEIKLDFGQGQASGPTNSPDKPDRIVQDGKNSFDFTQSGPAVSDVYHNRKRIANTPQPALESGSADSNSASGSPPVDAKTDTNGSAQSTTPVDFDGKCDSEIDCVRKNLLANGIDPDHSTVPVVVREPEPGQPEDLDHAEQVACVIKDPQLGLSRGARVDFIFDRIPSDRVQSGGRNSLRDFVVGAVDATTDTLRQSFLQPNSTLRIMNISNGLAPADLAVNVVKIMMDNPDQYASQIKSILGDVEGRRFIAQRRKALSTGQSSDTPQGSVEQPQQTNQPQGQCSDVRQPGTPQDEPDQEIPRIVKRLYQAVVSDIEQVFKSPAARDAMDRYRAVTKQVADRGGFIVVAAGNNGMHGAAHGARLSPDSQFNALAMSDHVIAVGASDTNGTPGFNADDRVAAISSRGTGRYNPTVLAPGVDVPSRQSLNGKLDGTSFSAPMVSGTIALMLQQNPALSFDAVKRILTANTNTIPNVSPRHQGSGVLRPADAIIAARSSVRRP